VVRPAFSPKLFEKITSPSRDDFVLRRGDVQAGLLRDDQIKVEASGADAPKIST